MALTICAGQPCGKIEFKIGTTGANAGGIIALSTGGGINVAVAGVEITLFTKGVANIWFNSDGN